MRTPQPVMVADLFPEILKELLALLSDLSEEEWSTFTACSGWTVLDVGHHLLGVEAANLSSRRDRHRISWTVDGWEELVAAINVWNEDWVKVTRRISPRLTIDLLGATGAQICDYFRSLDPYSIGGAVNWAGPEPAPVWLDVAREYTERWHHQQHIRDAVGRPGLKEPRYFAPVLAAFARALPRAYESTQAAENTSVTLEITGESGGQWSILRERGEWTLYEGAPERPDAKAAIEEDMAWRLFTRGLDPETARASLTIEGERDLGLRVREMVAIIA